MNYFERYSSRELAIVRLWIDTIPTLKEISAGLKRDNTGYHDCRLLFGNGWHDLIIEVNGESGV